MDRINSQFCVLYDDAPAESTDVGDTSLSRRRDGLEGLTHVSEGDETDEGDRSQLSSLAEAESLWRNDRRPRMGTAY